MSCCGQMPHIFRDIGHPRTHLSYIATHQYTNQHSNMQHWKSAPQKTITEKIIKYGFTEINKAHCKASGRLFSIKAAHQIWLNALKVCTIISSGLPIALLWSEYKHLFITLIRTYHAMFRESSLCCIESVFMWL